MKTVILILAMAIVALGQTAKPKPHHNFGPHQFAFARAIVNTPFSTKPLPALAGETGCSVVVMRGPKTTAPQGWKLEGGIFSGTPTAPGHFDLKISCTTPTAVDQGIALQVLSTAPAPTPPTPAPTPIPLN